MRVLNIYSGKKRTYKVKNKEFESSYKKTKVDKKVYINSLGIVDDTQADISCHGGVDRAICAFTKKAYEYFRKNHKLKLEECSFGENLLLGDICDDEVNLGDIYSLGEVLLEVCQPRVPCWKISYFTNIKQMTALTVKEAKTGFNLRVLKEGYASINDEFILEKRVSEYSIEFINRCFYNAKDNQENIKNILEQKTLASDYKAMLNKRYRQKNTGLESYQEDK